MPYLNLDLDYFEHRKTKRLIGLLGRGAEVLPIRLWSYCGKFHAEDGRLTGYTAQEIESLVGWWGRPGQMIEAMVSVGFLDREGDEIVVHEWCEHEGHIVSFHKRAKGAAQARWGSSGDDATSIATSNAGENGKHCPNLTNQPTKKKREPAGPAPPSAFAEVREFFLSRWNRRYGRAYPFRKVDGVKLAELMTVCGGSADEAKGVLSRFLANGDKFYEGHALSTLLAGSQLPKFLPSKNGKQESRPAVGRVRADN